MCPASGNTSRSGWVTVTSCPATSSSVGVDISQQANRAEAGSACSRHAEGERARGTSRWRLGRRSSPVVGPCETRPHRTTQPDLTAGPDRSAVRGGARRADWFRMYARRQESVHTEPDGESKECHARPNTVRSGVRDRARRPTRSQRRDLTRHRAPPPRRRGESPAPTRAPRGRSSRPAREHAPTHPSGRGSVAQRFPPLSVQGGPKVRQPGSLQMVVGMGGLTGELFLM